MHWPRKGVHSDRHIPGYINDIDVPPHFAQPNAVEFRPAVEWRHLSLTWGSLKRAMHAGHAAQLASIMELYIKVCVEKLSSLCKALGFRV